jgi:hypothetical protein
MMSTDNWPVDADGARIARPTVYQLDTGRPERDVLRSPEWQQQFLNFLYAHGIRKMHFIMGTSISVRQHEDDTLWVHTWQAVEGRPMCENCGNRGCIKQEEVVVPLAAPVLNVPGCFIKKGWLERLTHVTEGTLTA